MAARATEPSRSLDLSHTREVFEASTDFTIGLEEEFALVDPESLELVHRFEELRDSCVTDEVLAESVAGELIDTEIEIRSGRAETFAEAMELQRDRRRRLFDHAERLGIALAAMGTHPWASYLDQQIIDTEHYNRLREELRWVAQRNNTWSLHTHVGVRGADRAIAVCDHLRGVLPPLLALSANSPFLDGQDTGLHSVRTEIFTRSFPRCGVHEPFGDWATYADFIDLLTATGRVVESTQLWWSVRPHHHFGTVELRICDAQTRGDEAFGLAGLITACIAQSALDYDDGRLGEPLRQREIEENLWQAIRHGSVAPNSISRRARWSRPERCWSGSWSGPARHARGSPRPRIAGGERRPARPPGAGGWRGAGRCLSRRRGRDPSHLRPRARGRLDSLRWSRASSPARGAARGGRRRGADSRAGGAAAPTRGAAAAHPRPGPAAGERRQHPQPGRAPDHEARRARSRAGSGRNRGRPRGPRPARRGAARAGARGALPGADALRARGQGRRGRAAAVAGAAAQRRAAPAPVDPARQLIRTVPPATLRAPRGRNLRRF